MSIVLFHHPFTRAGNVVWMLEEVGAPYELRFVDIMKGEHKNPELLALNPMGKLPTLTEGDAIVTESAAIGLYLADRHSYGTLAPKADDPARAAYLRWSLFAPSVIEPGLVAKHGEWPFKPSQAGWGSFEDMIKSMEQAIEGRTYVLGDTFSMADVIFGGTIKFMLDFKVLEPRPKLVAYADRLRGRDAAKRADARNRQVMQEHGLKMP